MKVRVHPKYKHKKIDRAENRHDYGPQGTELEEKELRIYQTTEKKKDHQFNERPSSWGPQLHS